MFPMYPEFQGKTVLITGGASGMGRQTALDFAACGANVAVVTRRSEQAAKDTVAQIQSLGGQGIYVLADISVEDDAQRMVQATLDAFGRLDIAFNNAGLGPDGTTILRLPLDQVPTEDWDLLCNTNLRGLFLCLKYELQQMKAQGSGCIVTTASTAGLKPMPEFGAYGPSKAGAIMMTKVAAMETRDKAIRANVICPGPTLGTALADRSIGKLPEDGHLPTVGPTGVRMGCTTDISKTVLWLCSSQAEHINGNVITVDGGLDIF